MKKWLFCMVLAAGCFSLFGMTVEIKNSTPFKITGVSLVEEDDVINPNMEIPAGASKSMKFPDKLDGYVLYLNFEDGLEDDFDVIDDYKTIRHVEIGLKRSNLFKLNVSERSSKSNVPAGLVGINCQEAKITEFYVCPVDQKGAWKKCESVKVKIGKKIKIMYKVPVNGSYYVKFVTNLKSVPVCEFLAQKIQFQKIAYLDLTIQPIEVKITGEKDGDDDDED